MLDSKFRVEKIVKAMEDKKATDIKVYDTTKRTPYFDYVVICTGSSQRNVQAIFEQVKDEMEIYKSSEGLNEAQWILMDGGDIIVNIFTEETRQYYDLDSLYGENN